MKGWTDVAPHTESILSLCSGAGQLDRGVHAGLGGARTVCYVERELAAAAVLAARMRDGWLDNAAVWSDLLTFDGGAWRGRVSGIVAGIPCQPHSVAGSRRGADDPRDLWPHTARLIRDVSPEWFFLENVPGILRYYFDRIRPELCDMGFRVAEVLVTAEEVGAPHKRERLFVLADRNGAGRGGIGSGGLSGDGDAPRGRDADGCGAELADRNGAGRGGVGSGGVPGGEPPSQGSGVGDPDIAGLEGRQRPERERRYELPAWPPGPAEHERWAVILAERPDLAPAVEPTLRSVADGLAPVLDLSRTAQLRLTGNGVVPQQAERAFRLLRRELGL